MNMKLFQKLAYYTLQKYHVQPALYDDYVQELWCIYQQLVSSQPGVTPAYIIQRFKWYVLDQFTPKPEVVSLEEWMLSAHDERLLEFDLVRVLSAEEYALVQLLLAGYKGHEIARLLNLTPSGVSKLRLKIKQKVRRYLRKI